MTTVLNWDCVLSAGQLSAPCNVKCWIATEWLLPVASLNNLSGICGNFSAYSAFLWQFDKFFFENSWLFIEMLYICVVYTIKLYNYERRIKEILVDGEGNTGSMV